MNGNKHNRRQSRKPGRYVRMRRTYRPVLECLETRLAPANVDVLSYHNDLSLSGANLQETVLTPANVNPTQFGKLFSQPVDGYVYAEALYKANLTIPGLGTHNVAFVATEHDSVYAFDTDSNTGAGANPLWFHSFLDPPNGVTTIPSPSVVSNSDIVPEIGVTGTPVIDGTTNTLYVVAATQEVRSGVTHYVQKLHALDITTGNEQTAAYTLGDTVQGGAEGGWSNVSAISVNGVGDGSSGGVIRFNAARENNRSALQIVNGVVYVAFASHSDFRPYTGWVLGFDEQSLQPVKVFNTSPNSGGNGMWQSGGAVSADAQGNLYFALGNGFAGPQGQDAFNPTLGNWSESVLKLSATGQLSVTDYFTPFEWRTLDGQDADLGSGGVMLLPDSVGSTAHPRLMVELGKSGKLYLLDRDNMGHNVPSPGPDNVVQVVTAGQAGVWGNPTFFQINPGDGTPGSGTGIIYYHGSGDVLKGYFISNGHIDDTAADIMRSPPGTLSNFPGTQPVISADGTDPANPTNGIVWELQVDNFGGGTPQGNRPLTGPAFLRALDATDLTNVLYDSGSTAVGQRDLFGEPVKFTVPTVTNGHVLVGQALTFSVFGLFPEATALPPQREGLAAEVQAGTQGPQIHLAWTNPNAVPGADPTGIRIERSTDGVNFSPVTTVFRFNTDFTDLGPFEYRQHYFYRVVATNQLGDSAPSNAVNLVIVIAPATLTVTGTGSSSIGLSWTGVANDHYDIERSNGGANFTRIATVNAVQTSYTDTALAPGQYAYRIRAFNVSPDGESLSNVQGAWVGSVIDHSTPPLAGFANATDLTVNGSTFVSPSEHVVRLTNANNQTGSIFSNTRFTAGSFTTTFDVRLHEGTQPNYADGFTFDLQANSPTALGTGTAGIGYRGIGHSVAVVFSTFQHAGDPSSSSVGLSLNGGVPDTRVDTTPSGLLLNSQDIKKIDLTYDGVMLTVRVQDVVQPELVFTTSFAVNIAQVIGSDTAYVGFTGASGSGPGFWELEDVVDWKFTSQVAVPGAPTNLRETAFTSSAIDLAWNSNSYNETGFQIERSTDSAHFTSIATTTQTSYEDEEAIPSVTYFYRVRALSDQGNSPYSNTLRAGLPSAVLNQDLDVGTAGDPSVPGSATFANGAYTVTASGSDVYGTVDHFHYVYQPFLGDGEIVARLVSESATNPFTKAGIMVRESLAANAKKAFVLEFPATHGVPDQPAFNFRGQTGGTTTEVGGPANLPAPIWLRLVRSGSSLSAYWAADNGDPDAPGHGAWNQIGTSQTIIMSPNVYVGLALTSHANGAVSTGTFDHVDILPAALQTTHLDVRPANGAANPGTPLNITVTALDPYNNTVAGYRRTVHFSSSDAAATLPGDYTFTDGDGGSHTFTVTLGSLGRQTITVQDRDTTAVLGGTVVTGISDPVASSLFISGFPGHIGGGEAGTFTVKALDIEGNVLTGYRGTVQFSSSDLQAQFPDGYTFTPDDNGVHAFAATLNTYGVQSLTVSDATARIASTQSGIQVAPAAPAVTGTTITATAGKTFGVAAGFDGADDYIQVPSTLVVGGAITVEAWVKSANVFANWARVIDFANGPDTDNIIFGWQDGSGRLYWETHQGGATQMLIAPTVFPQNQWVHVAAVNDGAGTGFLYINGALVASGPQLIPATETRTRQWVARSNYGGDAFFGGSMEELHVWNTVRSTTQIQTDMNQLTGNEAGLVLYYPLDEASGNTAFDRTANHYDGTLTSTMAGDQPAWVADAGPGPRRVLASFTSADPAARASDFTVTIDWGGTHTSAGIVTVNGQGGFNVSGSNIFDAPGTFTVTVTVTDAFGHAGTAHTTAQVTATAPLFLVNGFPSSVQAGAPASVTVTALDAQGNVMTGYVGIVHFTSSDPLAQLPHDYMFTPDDSGVHSFSATLNTFGVQSITVTDLTAGITGTQRDIRVIPTPPVVTGTTITATEGKTFGVAAGFDGTDDYIQVPSTLVVGGAITIEAWVRNTSVLTPWARIIDFANGQNNDNIIFGWNGNNPGHLYFETYRNGQTIMLVAPNVFPQSQWVHVAAVNDGNGMGFIYINGVLAASGAQMIPATVTRMFNYIGRSNYPDPFFQGSMQELQIWRTTRSVSQIQSDMNGLSGTETGLAAYYPLDEARGTTAFDRTANHYDATLTSTGTGDQPAWVADAGPGPGRVVASFASADPAARPSDFTVTIAWGDGHTSAGIVTVNGQGGFNVSGSHTYAEEAGSFPLSIAVTDAFMNTGMAAGTVMVLDPPVTPTGAFNVLAVAGVTSRMQTVATFTDPGGAESLANYVAMVDWGDTTQSPGTIIGPVNGVFTVQAGHRYAQMGSYVISVTLTHDSAPSVTASDTAQILSPALQLLVTGFPSPFTAGETGRFTVTIIDQLGETFPSYLGRVHFSSSDAQAVLPADYTFTADDNGSKQFDARLRTAGTQSITATDTTHPAIAGVETGIIVNPAAMARFAVFGYPSGGSTFEFHTFTVVAVDAFGNRITNYHGTVHLSSDGNDAFFSPNDYTFTDDDAGEHVFRAAFQHSGTHFIRAVDTVFSNLFGEEDGIVVG